MNPSCRGNPDFAAFRALGLLVTLTVCTPLDNTAQSDPPSSTHHKNLMAPETPRNTRFLETLGHYRCDTNFSVRDVPSSVVLYYRVGCTRIAAWVRVCGVATREDDGPLARLCRGSLSQQEGSRMEVTPHYADKVHRDVEHRNPSTSLDSNCIPSRLRRTIADD